MPHHVTPTPSSVQGVRYLDALRYSSSENSAVARIGSVPSEGFNDGVRLDQCRAIVDGSADAIALLSSDGTIQCVTAAIERLSGYAPGELIGKSAFDLIHPDDRAAVRDAFRCGVDAPGVPIRVEYRSRHKDGSWRRREVVGVSRLAVPSIAAFVVNYRDTTARDLSDAALIERERIYQSTFDEALIGIAQTSLEGAFLRVNRHLCDLLGYTPEELTATDFMTISHPEDLVQDVEARSAMVAGAIDRYTREKRYRRKIIGSSGRD